MSRRMNLMREAAKAMEDGRDPLERSFLIEHKVSLDEVFTMSEDIARAVRIYLRMPSDERTVASIEAIADTVPEMADVLGFVAQGMKGANALKKLKALR